MRWCLEPVNGGSIAFYYTAAVTADAHLFYNSKMKMVSSYCAETLPTQMEFSGYITAKPETGMITFNSELKEHFYMRDAHFLKFITFRKIAQRMIKWNCCLPSVEFNSCYTFPPTQFF